MGSTNQVEVQLRAVSDELRARGAKDIRISYYPEHEKPWDIRICSIPLVIPQDAFHYSRFEGGSLMEAAEEAFTYIEERIGK